VEGRSKEPRSLETCCRGGQGPSRTVAPFGRKEGRWYRNIATRIKTCRRVSCSTSVLSIVQGLPWRWRCQAPLKLQWLPVYTASYPRTLFIPRNNADVAWKDASVCVSWGLKGLSKRLVFWTLRPFVRSWVFSDTVSYSVIEWVDGWWMMDWKRRTHSDRDVICLQNISGGMEESLRLLSNVHQCVEEAVMFRRHLLHAFSGLLLCRWMLLVSS
jgi:hypothetical protein